MQLAVRKAWPGDLALADDPAIACLRSVLPLLQVIGLSFCLLIDVAKGVEMNQMI